MPRRKESVPSVPFVLPTPEQQAEFDKLADDFDGRIAYGEQVTHIMSGAGEPIEKMGIVAIQPILTRLSNGNPLWFKPLEHIITRETGNHHPVEPEKGNFYDPNAPRNAFTIFEGEKRAWLKWGAKNGYTVKLPEQ